MKTYKSAAFAIASVFAATSVQAEPVPIEDLARLPAMQSVSVSADGDHMFALIGPTTGDDQDRAVLASWDLNDLTKPPVLSAPDGDTEYIFVSGLKNGYSFTALRQPFTGRLAGCAEGKEIGSTRTWLVKTFIANPTFSDFDEPFLKTTGTRGVAASRETCARMEARGGIVTTLPLDPDHVVISRFRVSDFDSEFVKLNLKTGETDTLYTNIDSDSDVYVDPYDAEIMSAVDLDEIGTKFIERLLLRDKKGGQLEEHPLFEVDSSTRQEVDVLHWDNEAGMYLILTNKFSDDRKEIYAYDPVAKTLSEDSVFAHPEFDASGVMTSQRASDFGRVLGFNYLADVGRTEWVDQELGGLVLGVEALFEGQIVNGLYVSDDRSKIVFQVEQSNQPIKYFMIKDRQLQQIGAARPWINPDHIGKTELVYYKTRDGKDIPALLTPRAGWSEGDDPGKAVVLPHGGPWARDFGGWDSSGWVAFLTSRGFTVLQPQYRGSTDWGLQLWKAGDGQYGYKAQDDKDDGAEWLVDQGYADAGQIAMFGYSYGGYAAMTAATRSNSPYQCAIAGAGYGESDKINVYVDDSRFGRLVFADAISGRDVIRDVERSEIPILVYHGDRDVRVPDTYGRDFYRAVRRHTNAKYVNIPDMPHSLPWTPDQHRLSLGAIERFLDNECGFDW
ncbi:MAG: prolyl oligopeptidase family serine peptidase [Pseudomonadota bacterium]